MSETLDWLVTRWRESGVNCGDTLLLHSSAKRTLLEIRRDVAKDLAVNVLLESFLAAVGPTGTLLLPLFNFDFAKGAPFDFRNTPSQMGALTEVGRSRPNAVRTGHPIYSFCAIGAQSRQFEHVDNRSGYGSDSPFAMLRDMDGKIGVLDLPDQNSMTFYHHVEELKKVPYRYHKEFSGLYTDVNGNQSQRVYSLFVRDLEKGVETHVDPAGEMMWRGGLYEGDRPNVGSGLRTIKASMMFDFVSALIDQGRALGNLYRINDSIQ